MPNIKYSDEDILLRHFPNITVIEIFRVNGRRYAHCECQCGKQFKRAAYDLMRFPKASVSCGCIGRAAKRRKLTKHGHSTRYNGLTSEYYTWQGMWQRCTNPNHKGFARYGGRGIEVYDKWIDFNQFIKDVGPKPYPKATLDRIDNDGNYEPGNVKWASYKEQAINRDTTRWIEYDGKRMNLTQWAEYLGIHPSTLHGRIKRHGVAGAIELKKQ